MFQKTWEKTLQKFQVDKKLQKKKKKEKETSNFSSTPKRNRSQISME